MISANYGAAGSGSAALSQMRQQMFTKLDANASGGIDQAEFVNGATSGSSEAKNSLETAAKEVFNSFDSDSNGSLTQGELESGFQKLSDQVRGKLLEAQENSSKQQYSSDDANSDGGIDLKEFLASAPRGDNAPSEAQIKEVFDSLDGNSDGSLTQDELEAAYKSNKTFTIRVDDAPLAGIGAGGSAAGVGSGGVLSGAGAGGHSSSQAASASQSPGNKKTDTLEEMLKESIEGDSKSKKGDQENLKSILANISKLQNAQMSQNYSATT